MLFSCFLLVLLPSRVLGMVPFPRDLSSLHVMHFCFLHLLGVDTVLPALRPMNLFFLPFTILV